MNTKKKLQAFFDASHDDAQYVQAYEENIEFFNELLRTGRVEELDYVLPIKLLKYAGPLGLVGQYTKALRVLGEVEKELPKLRGHSRWIGTYEESLTFWKAFNLARLKRYRASNALFLQLLSGKRTNEKYENWYRSNKKAMVEQYSLSVVLVGVGGYLLLMGVEWIAPEWHVHWVKTAMLAIALLAFVVSALWKYVIDRMVVHQPLKKRSHDP